MVQRAKGLKRADKSPALQETTVFTDGPLETRRKLKVVLSVRAMKGRVEVKLTSPVSEPISLSYVERDGHFNGNRFRFDLRIDAEIEQFLDVVMEPVMAPSVTDDVPVAAQA